MKGQLGFRGQTIKFEEVSTDAWKQGGGQVGNEDAMHWCSGSQHKQGRGQHKYGGAQAGPWQEGNMGHCPEQGESYSTPPVSWIELVNLDSSSGFPCPLSSG